MTLSRPPRSSWPSLQRSDVPLHLLQEWQVKDPVEPLSAVKLPFDLVRLGIEEVIT